MNLTQGLFHVPKVTEMALSCKVREGERADAVSVIAVLSLVLVKKSPRMEWLVKEPLLLKGINSALMPFNG